VRNDAAEAHARVEESEARKALVQQLCDQVGAMQDRINALADELEARHRADARVAARQAELDAEPIEHPSGDPPSTDPSLGDPGDDGELTVTHHPSGDLHVLHGPDAEDPEDGLPEPSQYPQPISISLNEH
jgi:hypothetical protein